MAFPVNPMGINGPNSSGNYVQPNQAIGAGVSNPNIADYPVGANALTLTWPLPPYTQPGVSKNP
jgi:hypothetical protein